MPINLWPMLGMFHLFVVNLIAFHPFYISMTELNYDQKQKTLEVSVRVFTDDLEKAVRKDCGCKAVIMSPADKQQSGKHLSAYISKHLQLIVDGKPTAMRFVGYQQEEGSTWSFFEVAGLDGVKKIGMVNNLLYDENSQQVNMLRIQGYGKERSDKLEYPATNYSYSF
ncbi:hypothetical protein EXU57_02875 [Segetibacter sp. 3557_3]|uniref:DUF6702 family protein n=1 Tax=Segetibacter sp. 3557_3 TaxID=2547429 RepID=UPI00105857F6|nr:DUF6702 family protein [Segetibacter sp. 3557_3]TDH29033.1 hypothetical protein EXU57_02875 [Segetibacter sp. 3557_3]